MALTQQDVLNALSEIIDPDLQRDIVSLGFVQNIEIGPSSVAFDIELTTPACPIKDRFKTDAERLVGALPGVESVQVNMTSRASTRAPKQEKSGLTRVKALIAVASGKGGVGKSTVAAAVALELAERGYKVGLLDADLFGPSVPTLFRLHDVELYQDEAGMIIPITVGPLQVVSFGFLLGDSPAIMRGPMVSGYMQQLLHQVAWGELDYLFLDLPPGTGDIQLTITQAVELDGALIVTTPQALAYPDVGKGILMFDRVDVPVLGVVENMAYFDCESCGTRHEPFGTGGAARLAERYGIPVLGELPLAPDRYGGSFENRRQDDAVREAVDRAMMALGTVKAEGIKKPEIAFNERQIALNWENGATVALDNHTLRSNCQCASCVDEFSGERKLDPSRIRPDIKAEDVATIGNYAIAIEWNDGHSSGFFPYRKIRELAAERS